MIRGALLSVFTACFEHVYDGSRMSSLMEALPNVLRRAALSFLSVSETLCTLVNHCQPRYSEEGWIGSKIE